MPHRVTYAVLLTPRGRGAVATVLVAGPDAARTVGSLVRDRQGRPISLEPLGRIRLGLWNHSGATEPEDVVVVAIAADRVEIHCHGGRAAPQAICDALVAAGCEAIDWRTWCGLDGGTASANSALAALAQARTERTATILLDQYQGALVRALAEMERLIMAADWPAAREAVEQVLAWQPIGAHLVEPWRVVLAGPPNVGKSSLVNALVGYQRAIVYDAPGTTRDMVTATTALAGWPVELCDTAGLRAAQSAIEAEGVALARRAVAAADALVLVFSSDEAWRGEFQELREQWPGAILVYSKCDLARPSEDRPAGIATSAVARTGLDELERAIINRLVPAEPAPGAAIPIDGEQVELLERLLAAIDARAVERALAVLAAGQAGNADGTASQA